MGDITIGELPDLASSSNTYIPISDGIITGKTLTDTLGMPPAGTIAMWSNFNGSPVPIGWQLCNGENGTPDLRNKFIVGSGSTYTTGDVGGLSSVTLGQAQLASHNHSINDSGHNHSSAVITSGTLGGSGLAPRRASGNTSSSTTGITVNFTGGGGEHENRPPYYTLAYIMKL